MSGIEIYHTRESLKSVIESKNGSNRTLGFVPTMGALHAGHLALVAKALSECDVVIVSIFVNPTQFNNASDLEKYPRTPEKDLELLVELNGEILVFLPSVDEVYPSMDDFPGVDISALDSVLEGKFRPGHFEGVVHVVYNLFEIVQPNKAYFGWKDFQQVAVIKSMVNQLNLPVEIVACPTLREDRGLAMSSRNMRLNAQEKEDALIIFKSLEYLKSLKEIHSPSEAKEMAISFFNQGNLELEYFEIVDGDSLKSLSDKWTKGAVCCIAAYCGMVRLIDNMEMN
jgi:pantoate--beta-alanine ligase